MGKRSNFERIARRFLPDAARGGAAADPASARGAHVRRAVLLATARWCAIWNPSGCAASMPATSRPARTRLRSTLTATADAIITNPPYTRELMHALIAHFQRIAPTWLLIDYDWSATKQAAAVHAPLLGHRGTPPPEMVRGLEGHRQGQPRLVQVRCPA